jgi:C1A family cysteine protease
LQKKNFINTICGELVIGHSIYAGVLLDDSFLNDDHGYIVTPNLSTFQPTGGHAICIVGYGPFNDQKKQVNYFKFFRLFYLHRWCYNLKLNSFVVTKHAS